MQEQLGFNAAGEGGEFETLVLDCPMFKQKITVKKAKPKTSYVDNKVN